MKIERIKMHDFSAFADATAEFCSGINVFIGENSTGKSHLLKLLYAVVKSIEQGGTDPDKLKVTLADKLAGVFLPDDDQIGRLVQRRVGRHTATVDVGVGPGAGTAHLTLSSLGRLTARVESWPAAERSVFIPSREVLAMFEGFIGLWQERKVSFDETYYDVCLALDTPPLRGPRGDEAGKLFRPIEKALGGRVTKSGSRFYVSLEGGNMEAHLVAEGLRKLAAVAWLIGNGALRNNGVLFWDEPEANLNPHLIARVAEFLQAMADSGVQIFIATHDYLLSSRLSLARELERTHTPMKFFSVTREKKGAPSTIESGDTLADLANNPILDEFSRLHRDQLNWSADYVQGEKKA